MPHPGWVEHDPMTILKNVEFCVSDCLKQGNLALSDLAAIGITNQRETLVIWDKFTGLPVYNAIVWMDCRGDEVIHNFTNAHDKEWYRQKTGLPLSSYFTGPKLNWALTHVPEVKKGFEEHRILVGTIDCWLIWNLTGGVHGGLHITDITNASRTMMMNIRTHDWDDDLLAIVGVDRSVLPRIVSCSEVYGTGVGCLDGVKIAGSLGDQQAALFGQTCFEAGEMKNTYGTGCFILMNTGDTIVDSQNGLVTTVAYKIGATGHTCYALEGSITIAGALVQWLRDNLGMIRSSSEIEAMATSVDSSEGMYVVPAFSGLYAPHWRSDARGVFVGLTRMINKNHICRAVLEATAYQTYDVFNAMERDSGIKITSMKVDGGMTANNFLMQFQANILNTDIVIPKVTETTALGACFAAGLAVGYWTSMDDIREKWVVDKTFHGVMDQEGIERRITGWRKAIEKSLNWVEEE
ncbi:uncharacterized protein [Blastocystis hominis]|uniref:glycerol kinase n=1 Tax=Blastocystis hominis TaxID=12968 RepID=D8M1K3_BLAHO|nr:uncharacterized protein [Blastocystis hominis]CBK21942.2 unnamed protein product [Blastocystis hominis]|eukprot:XP_012895990.1 uncharacterized protein [Blastocystis hominis]